MHVAWHVHGRAARIACACVRLTHLPCDVHVVWAGVLENDVALVPQARGQGGAAVDPIKAVDPVLSTYAQSIPAGQGGPTRTSCL